MSVDYIEQVLDLAIAIQQIPAPTFNENKRGEFVRNRFLADGLSEIEVDSLGNIYGRIPGKSNAPPLIVSAHLDTVFPLGTLLAVRRESERIAGPGIGDNALGVAGLFALIWDLRQRGIVLHGDLWLVANVGEEGLGDLRGMRSVVDRFGANVKAYIVLEGMALGQVYHRGLGVTRYRISVHTTGGHSWADYGNPSAIHELGMLIHKLSAMPLPLEPRTTLNVGVISGGTSVNTIAQDAYLELDLRSEHVRALDRLVGQVESLIHSSRRDGVQIKAELIGQRPAGEIPADHPLVCLVMNCLDMQGMKPCLNIGSTDANIPLSRDIPAVCIGLTTGGGAHTKDEYIYTRPLQKGLRQLVTLIEQVYQRVN